MASLICRSASCGRSAREGRCRKRPFAGIPKTGHHPHLQKNFRAASWEQVPRQGREQRGGPGCPAPTTAFLHRGSWSRCSPSHRRCPRRGRMGSLGSPRPVPTAPSRPGTVGSLQPVRRTVPQRWANVETGHTAKGERPGSSESF